MPTVFNLRTFYVDMVLYRTFISLNILLQERFSYGLHLLIQNPLPLNDPS